jgi:mannose/fructose/N-acetylgalactosamine-specific phosphotransferase system component IID
LDFLLLIRIFFRSFFIQTVYNYQSLLSIGFCYSIAPILKKLYLDRENRKQFLYRHLNFFNAHPYFASFAIGAVANIEKMKSEDKIRDPAVIERFKNALIGPMGAIGDQLFWVTIRPACIFLAMAGIVMIPSLNYRLLFLLFVFTVYNIPHIYIRFYGLWKGYKMGFNIYKLLNVERYRLLMNFYMFIGAIALGIFMGYTMASLSSLQLSYLIVFLASTTITYLYRKYKQSFYGSILISLSSSLILGLILEQL